MPSRRDTPGPPRPRQDRPVCVDATQCAACAACAVLPMSRAEQPPPFMITVWEPKSPLFEAHRSQTAIMTPHPTPTRLTHADKAPRHHLAATDSPSDHQKPQGRHTKQSRRKPPLNGSPAQPATTSRGSWVATAFSGLCVVSGWKFCIEAAECTSIGCYGRSLQEVTLWCGLRLRCRLRRRVWRSGAMPLN
jgi:hypothetical protein